MNHKLAVGAAAKELGEVQARMLMERELAQAQQQVGGARLRMGQALCSSQPAVHAEACREACLKLLVCCKARCGPCAGVDVC